MTDTTYPTISDEKKTLTGTVRTVSFLFYECFLRLDSLISNAMKYLVWTKKPYELEMTPHKTPLVLAAYSTWYDIEA
jgi:hypothetical protein